MSEVTANTEVHGVTIDDLLRFVKRMKEGWGGQTVIKNLVINNHAYSLKRCRGIKVYKHGRGAAREHDAEILFYKEEENFIDKNLGWGFDEPVNKPRG